MSVFMACHAVFACSNWLSDDGRYYLVSDDTDVNCKMPSMPGCEGLIVKPPIRFFDNLIFKRAESLDKIWINTVLEDQFIFGCG